MANVYPHCIVNTHKKKQDKFHNYKTKLFWGSFETGFLDLHTMFDAYKFCATDENTLTNLRRKYGNQEQNTNRLMNRINTPFFLC